MIEYKTGDIFQERAEALVNPVNCVGVMGRGLARSFKIHFPANFRSYRDAVQRRRIQPGVVFVFDTGTIHPPFFILNFPTKRHYRDRSNLVDIAAGLRDLVKQLSVYKIQSVAIPALGCGLGGLAWDDVRPLIEAAFSESPDVLVRVFVPRPSNTTVAMLDFTTRNRVPLKLLVANNPTSRRER